MKTLAVYQSRFWAAYLVQMRPYLLFVSGIAGFSGMVFGSESLSGNTFLKFLPFFLGYGFGQALTDTFQTDTDALSAPYRPLSRGILRGKDVLFTSLLGLLAVGVTLMAFSLWNILLTALSVVGLATYSYFKKNHTMYGPVHNGWIVALLPLMGWLCSTSATSEIFENDIHWLSIMIFFSYMNFVLLGYLKDITADRATGYETFPVVFGWNKTVYTGAMILILTILSSLPITDFKNGWSFVYWICAVSILSAGIVYAFLKQNRTEAKAGFPVTATVRSFLLFNMAAIAAKDGTWNYYLLVFYALFEITLFVRPQRNQV